jgi:hypothetical protein
MLQGVIAGQATRQCLVDGVRRLLKVLEEGSATLDDPDSGDTSRKPDVKETTRQESKSESVPAVKKATSITRMRKVAEGVYEVYEDDGSK